MSDPTSPRSRFLEVTSRLLESQGYHATGLNQIVAESGAPKGSMYHYFPGGKEELAAEAIEAVGRRMVEGTRWQLGRFRDPAESVRQFVLGMAERVGEKNFCGGNPITLPALESSAHPVELGAVLANCAGIYCSLTGVFADRLVAAGLEPARAASMAAVITAAIEGGMILSRTQRKVEPLEKIAEELYGWIKATL